MGWGDHIEQLLRVMTVQMMSHLAEQNQAPNMLLDFYTDMKTTALLQSVFFKLFTRNSKKNQDCIEKRQQGLNNIEL